MKKPNMLETIKRIPFFTTLLLCILVIRLYQVLHKNPSLLRNLIQKTHHTISIATEPVPTQSTFVEAQQHDINQGIKRTDAQISYLKQQVAALQDQVVILHQKVEKSIEKPDTKIITENIKQLNTTSLDQKNGHNIKPPKYFLHAIVPGRAWLSTQEGQIITVSVGSTLPVLGIVKNLDADRELVHFNTGKIIGSHPDNE